MKTLAELNKLINSLDDSTDQDILDYMAHFPDLYKDCVTVEDYFAYHKRKQEQENDEAYALGWEGLD